MSPERGTPDRRTLVFVADEGEVADLVQAAQVSAGAVDAVILDRGDEGLDELQDAVYDGTVGRIILPSLELLGPDLMAQEMILAGWLEKGIAVFSLKEPDLGVDDPARRDARGVLGEIDDYGKIPWVP
ncbi:MAG: hypothetical protein ACRDYV_14600 [Acidimicrobiia bacterium]